MYNADGTKRGGEFQVNTQANDFQVRTSVTSISTDRFVVAWEGYSQNSSDSEIYAQIYDSDGTKVGVEFQMNTYIDGFQMSPSLAGLNDGDFIGVWQSENQDGSGYGIFGQKFDSNGAKVNLLQDGRTPSSGDNDSSGLDDAGKVAIGATVVVVLGLGILAYKKSPLFHSVCNSIASLFGCGSKSAGEELNSAKNRARTSESKDGQQTDIISGEIELTEFNPKSEQESPAPEGMGVHPNPDSSSEVVMHIHEDPAPVGTGLGRGSF